MQLQEKKVASGDDAVVIAFSTTGAEPANGVPDPGVNEHRVVHLHRSRRSRRRRAANRYAWRFPASPALACAKSVPLPVPCAWLTVRCACGVQRSAGLAPSLWNADDHRWCAARVVCFYDLQVNLLQVLRKQHLHWSVNAGNLTPS